MKHLVLISLLLSCGQLIAQSITVEPHDNNVNESNSTSILGDLGTEITIQNVSNETIDIKVSRQLISATQGTSNYFCWTACYPANVSVSPEPKSFSPQQVDVSSFQVHFDNQGVDPANASIKYCAFDADNPADSACAIVNFSVGTSSIESKTSSTFSNFHPNPTTSLTSIDYAFSSNYTLAKIVVTDMLGNVVKIKHLKNQEGKLRFDVSNTPNGLYFANIYVDGQLIEIKRLVINR